VTTGLLKVQHDFCQLVVLCCTAFSHVADFVVLAEIAPQAAIAEKDRSGSVASHQGHLFAKMGMISGYYGLAAGFAGSGFPGSSVHTAAAGTQGAVGQCLESLVRPAFEEAGLQCVAI
jgi:hypothetical protein